MNNRYALVSDSSVIDVILWDGAAYQAGSLGGVDENGETTTGTPPSGWSPPKGIEAIVLPGDSVVSPGWTYDGLNFSEPPPPQKSATQILSDNTAMRDQLLSSAALAIAPLQDAVDLDEATGAETSLLKQWKQYRVAVNRVDLTKADADWPAAPA